MRAWFEAPKETKITYPPVRGEGTSKHNRQSRFAILIVVALQLSAENSGSSPDDAAISINSSMKVKELIKPNEIAVKAADMSYPNVYDKKNRDYGRRTKTRTERVTIRDSKTGKIYGYRTVVQKAS